MSFNDWNKVKLKDITTKIGSGSTPRGGSSAYKKEGIPFIRSQNIYNCNFSKEGLVFIDDEQAKKLSNVKIDKDDILLNITGDSVARCTKVPPEYIGGYVNQHVSILRANKEELESSYLKYYLINPITQKLMLSLAQSGGTRAALTKGMIENLDIILPSIDEQRAIANILLPLDDKIEVNNKTNQKLEEIAQVIFKQWFIDFNFPNEEGKPYKSSGGEMVESELGMIPEGWEVLTLEDIFIFKKGKKPKEIVEIKESEDYLKYLTIDVLNRNSNLYTRGEKLVECNDNDILMVMDGASSGTIYTGMSGIVGSTLAKLETKNNIIKPLIYQYLKFRQNDIRSHLTGSAIPHADKKYIHLQQIALPIDVRALERLIRVLDINMKKIKINNEENYKLKDVRDSLLPKLMSGEIRVPVEN